MRVCVIIPAAGSSRRFGNQDKLTQDLGGRAVLIRTVECFARRDEVSEIIVAGPPDDFASFRDRFEATLGFHGAKVVQGGAKGRWETVSKAIDAAQRECTHIAVHDAARPCVSDALIERVFLAGRTVAAVVPGIAISSTVKRVNEEPITLGEQDENDAPAIDAILGDEGRPTVEARAVAETIDRRNLVLVQTPQLFEAELLRKCYQSVDVSSTTDDAGVIEAAGETVHVVAGEEQNIKITTPDDLRLARMILGVNPPAERPAHLRF